jgi:hypothetical protein
MHTYRQWQVSSCIVLIKHCTEVIHWYQFLSYQACWCHISVLFICYFTFKQEKKWARAHIGIPPPPICCCKHTQRCQPWDVCHSNDFWIKFWKYLCMVKISSIASGHRLIFFKKIHKFWKYMYMYYCVNYMLQEKT